MTLPAGELVGGKYRILRLIGDGGMGSVYEARHEQLGVPVALKFLRPDIAERPGLAARFLQEARVSATLNSPHVAHVTDVDTAANGAPYLVMELLSGESLQSLLDRRGALGRDEAIDFALQILVGLDTAHALGVVHRDLKPDNVFVTPSNGGPLLKLIDFGIAKLRESNEFKKELTSAGVVMGTPEYMAPEQLYAAHEVDARADIYSLGVMLFEMLSGTRPADGDDVERIVGRVLTGEVKHLGSLLPDLPNGLVAVVEKAMHPNRDERFGSADEFRLALAPFAGALSREGELARARPPNDRPRSLVEAGAAVNLTGHGPANPESRVPQPRVSASLGVADTLDGPPPSRVPKTLPPDGGAPAARGTEIAAPLPVPERVTGAQRVRRRKRRSTLWIWLLAVVSVLLGAGLVVVLSLPRKVTLEIPALPQIELGGAPGAIVIDPGATRPGGGSASRPPSVQTVPSPQPQGAPTPRAPGAPAPLPFPSFALPSALPPHPSGFPASLPSTFPPILPSTLPQIPGLPFPFPGAPAPPASTGTP
jgi:serine/threonine-protein kinase